MLAKQSWWPPRPPWSSVRSPFTHTRHNYHPLTNLCCGQDRSTGRRRRCCCSTHTHREPPPPKVPRQYPLVALKTIQTAHNQWKVIPRHPDLPPTPAVTSRWQPVLERVLMTQIIPSCVKTCLQSWTTCRKFRDTFANSSRCKRWPQLILRIFPN